MVFRNFRFKIIVRVLLMVVCIFAMIYVFMETNHYFTLALLSVVLIYLIFSMVYFVEKSNRDLTSFLESVRYSDFSRTFQISGLGRSFDNLKSAFSAVISDFQKIRSEKEEHYFYMQNIIQHIEISIISYLGDGTVEMINNATKKLFQLRTLKNINELKEWNEELVNILKSIEPGEDILVKVQDHDDILQLAIHATEFKLDDRRVKLVSIKNIQAELEEQEMEAWQKLIRVLTHEIMNSIAPISSLANTANGLVKEIVENPENLDEETVEDVTNALNTIHKRSTGLMHFVETYRNLTRIPKPNFEIFEVKTLLDYIHNLHAKDLERKSIQCTRVIEPENLQLTADEQLIEQVIINLITNSIQALENTKNPCIEVKAFLNKRGRVTIQVADNGQGIIEEVRDKIFIPFFTTKQNGSGIGLSLSKQILRLHNGTIAVQSEPDVRTCFTLTF